MYLERLHEERNSFKKMGSKAEVHLSYSVLLTMGIDKDTYNINECIIFPSCYLSCYFFFLSLSKNIDLLNVDLSMHCTFD